MLRLRLSYLVVWLKCGIFRIMAIQKPKNLHNFLRIYRVESRAEWEHGHLLKNVLNNACIIYEKN